MAIWKYKTEKGEIVSKLFEDEKDIPKGWKDSPQEAGKKKTTKKMLVFTMTNWMH